MCPWRVDTSVTCSYPCSWTQWLLCRNQSKTCGTAVYESSIHLLVNACRPGHLIFFHAFSSTYLSTLLQHHSINVKEIGEFLWNTKLVTWSCEFFFSLSSHGLMHDSAYFHNLWLLHYFCFTYVLSYCLPANRSPYKVQWNLIWTEIDLIDRNTVFKTLHHCTNTFQLTVTRNSLTTQLNHRRCKIRTHLSETVINISYVLSGDSIKQ